MRRVEDNRHLPGLDELPTVKNLAERPGDFLFISETVAAANEKSLYLLRAIETSVTSLGLTQRFLQTFAGEISEHAERLRTGKRITIFDPDGSVTESFERTEKGVEALRDELLHKLEVVRSNHGLSDDDRSCVEDAFRGAIDAAAELHNALVDARWTIGEHDADLQPADRSVLLSSREDIDEYLKTL